MIYRWLGNTGFQASVLGLGGEAALYKRGDQAVSLIEKAVDLGVNYFDTAPIYQDSELNYGDVLPHHRKKMFIATKTDQRDYDGAWKQFEASLKRLKVGRVDLLQIHHLNEMPEVDAIHGKAGALRMAQEAQEQGLVSFIGVTGHRDPDVIAEAIRRFQYDTALLSLNPADVHLHSFQEKAVPAATKRGVGIVAMKVLGRGLIPQKLGIGSEDLLRYALAPPVDCAIIGVMNQAQLEKNVASAVAAALNPMDALDMTQLEIELEAASGEINFYRKGSKAPWPEKLFDGVR